MDQGLDIVVSENERYLRITLAGAFRAEHGSAHYRKIAELSDASGHMRFLLDVRGITTRASIPDTFEYVVHNYPKAPDNRRTASLDLPENMVSARFFEHLMQNQGRTYRLFLDEAEALAWLLSDQP